MQNYINLRLKEERERLGLSQVAMGDIGGVKKLTQLNYEKGKGYPDAAYLSKLSKFGLDTLYVVTGERNSNTLTSDELELINKYRTASSELKAAALGALTAGTEQKGIEVNISNISNMSGGQVAGGGIYNSSRKGKK